MKLILRCPDAHYYDEWNHMRQAVRPEALQRIRDDAFDGVWFDVCLRDVAPKLADTH